MNIQRKIFILMAAAALIGANLACNLPSSGPDVPEETIPVTTQAVEDLQDDIAAAATQAETSGTVTLEMDEAELTSMVTFELQQQESPPISDIQVYLRDGQILITGNAQQDNLSLPVVAAVTVQVDAQGQPVFTITSAKVGPFPLPQRNVDQLTDQLRTAFEENIRPRMGDVVLTSITIADGKMVIEGRTR